MDVVSPLLSSEARVSTPVARRYLGQLCKHFQHKLPVTLDERNGRIEFPAGVCEVEARDGKAGDVDARHAAGSNSAVGGSGLLVLRVMAHEADQLTTLEAIVARHLERFAFREHLKVDWRRAA